MTKKIPLAWLQLTRKKIRLLVALAGISFADILMFMQLGFQDALYDSAVRFHTHLQGDAVLISPQSVALVSMQNFSERRLYQALNVDGVESANPVYLDYTLWRNPQTRLTRNIFIIGFNPAERVLDLPEVHQNIENIKIPDVVLFDEASRTDFGSIAAEFNRGKVIITEVGRRRITVGGLFNLGTSFGANGTLITSDLNFIRVLPERKKGLIDVGVIKLKPGVDPKLVLKKLKTSLPKDVKVMSIQEYKDFEKNYWRRSTAIGFIFTLGTIMGFIVGIVIVYQILYADVSDHLAEYATLKSMGYKDIYLLGVVLQEALILALLGYIPGFTIPLGLYSLTRNATRLPLFMTIGRASLVLVLTILMCLISGAFAMRKLQTADPADLF